MLKTSKFVAGHVTKAHMSVPIKRLTRYKQKVVLAAMLEGKSMPFNMAANTNHTTLLKDQSAIKYLPYMHFLSHFGCKIIFMCSVNFWHKQDSSSLFKGSIGHVASSSGLRFFGTCKLRQCRLFYSPQVKPQDMQRKVLMVS